MSNVYIYIITMKCVLLVLAHGIDTVRAIYINEIDLSNTAIVDACCVISMNSTNRLRPYRLPSRRYWKFSKWPAFCGRIPTTKIFFYIFYHLFEFSYLQLIHLILLMYILMNYKLVSLDQSIHNYVQ